MYRPLASSDWLLGPPYLRYLARNGVASANAAATSRATAGLARSPRTVQPWLERRTSQTRLK